MEKQNDGNLNKNTEEKPAEKENRSKTDQPQPKAAEKAKAKPETKAEAKPETKAEVKPETKEEAKSETKGEAKPETKGEAKPETKGEAKSETKAEGEPEKKAVPVPDGKKTPAKGQESEGKPPVKGQESEGKTPAKGQESEGKPRRKKKKSKKGRKRRIAAQIIVCVLLVILFSGSALGGAVVAYYTAATNAVETDTETALRDANVVETDLVYDQDVVNILLIGADKRAAETDSGRSDTTMIATVDIKNGKLKLTSFMRDMYIDVPGYGYHKFNAAYSYGGVQLEYETIAENFGIKLDGYVEVDMEAFREVVDILGGITMDLTEAEAYYLQTAYVNSKHGEKNVVAGKNLLTAYQALAYCRIRQDVSGEFGRTDRQRKVLISIFDSMKEQNIMTITNLCMKALNYVKTDLTEEQIRSLITSVISMGTTEVEQLRIPYEGTYTEGRLGGTGAWVMECDYEMNSQALQWFIFGTGEDPGIDDEYGIGNNNFIEGYYPQKTEGQSTY